MNIIEKPVEKLIPYTKNAKIHSEKQIELLMKSIDLTKGLRQPIIIDKNNVVVAGHGRLEAAKRLGYKKVPCELVDDLSEDEIKLYRLLDNRSSSVEYDLDLEFEELSEIELDVSEFDFELFNMEDIEEVNGFDENNNNREFFTAAFTFPTAQKEQILKYLRKHKAEITADIIEKAGVE